jgi:ParB family chromosome partitioning protein
VQLKPAYALAQAMDDAASARKIADVARYIAAEQEALRERGAPPLPASDVMRRLIEAPRMHETKPEPYRAASRYGRTMLSVQSANRQGVTLRLHAGSGASEAELIDAVRDLLAHLERTGKGLR